MKNETVYQFKIALTETLIWRRIQVPSTYSFWDLHVAIQDAMGWMDSHLHLFDVKDPKTGELVHIGIPDDHFPTLAGWEEKVSKYLSFENNKADYTYDLGDNWCHKVVLEKILPKNVHMEYPVCVDGARACPPEDCGGVGGYENMLETLKGPRNEEYESIAQWLGRVDFDPEAFNPKAVVFDDPKKRLNNVLE